MPAADPYRYFRIEARELLDVLGRGALALERGSPGDGIVGPLLRAAHTLKGASRVVRQTDISELAHAIEDALTPYREGAGDGPPPPARHVLELVDAIAARVSRLDPSPVADERFQSARVDTAEMDRLLARIVEASVPLGTLRGEIDAIERAALLSRRLLGRLDDVAECREIGEELEALLDHHRREFGAALDRAERELAQVRDTVNTLRLVPARALFAPIERAVHDGAQALGKSVEFLAEGGEHRLDAHVVAVLQDALLHVARNAVAHGIERPAERVAAGKPVRGRVTLRVERAGPRVVFSCSDDGRGIDVEAVRHQALRRNAVPAAELAALGHEQVVQLLLRGGMTTAITPTEMSGRGIGLDVVREAMARLRGDVTVRTTPGQGTTFELRVPFSLTSIPALRVEADGVTCCIPVAAIRAAMRVPREAIARTTDGASIEYEGAVVPFVPLAAVLGRAETGRAREHWSTAIVHAAGRTTAVGVDRMLGTTNVLSRPIPAWVGARPVVAGASLDPSSHPWLVLDPEALTQRRRLGPADHATAAPPAPILVVDDSLTTRMLEQSILESAGFDVDLATSGEEALEKALARRYGLMIVDVEMPGIDGFELLRRAQALPALRDVPAILVTSRNAPEDRRRGEAAGARAYIVKSEFDQAHLLKTIRQLVGAS